MKFRKKPVVIEAIQWDGNNKIEIIKFTEKKVIFTFKENYLIIPTLEGQMKANKGDWIIKGYSSKQGYHFWPVKPDYFVEHYEKVEE